MKHLIFLSLILLTSIGYSQQYSQAFLPDIIKQFPNVRDIALTPNGDEIMFTSQSVMGNLSVIITVKRENNKWETPQIASFSGQFFDLEPTYSTDGLTLYFASSRAINSSTLEPKDFDIWFVTRKNLNCNWSEPKNLGSPINTNHDEFYPSIAHTGNLYFTRDNPELNQKDDIYFSKLTNGIYLDPVTLPNTINTNGYEYNAFISPDESFLIYGSYNRKDGFGSGDLYISYHTENGWNEAKNLGSFVNTDKMDYCPFYDSSTKTLYFTSKMDKTKTQFDKPMSLENLLNEFNKYENGLSRLYSIKVDLTNKN